MAKIEKNLVTSKFRGMIGGTLVFRSVNGETVVSAAPSSSSKQPTAKQLKMREKFRQANLYARLVKADTVLRPVYEQAFKESDFNNLHSVIVTDYLREPVIAMVNCAETKSGVQISIVVDNLVEAKSVQLSIQTPDSVELENGNASMSGEPKTWNYSIQDSSVPATGIQIVVTATDYPGNVTHRAFTF